MALGGDGELYVLSKTDGMIRKLTAVVTPPRLHGAFVGDCVALTTRESDLS